MKTPEDLEDLIWRELAWRKKELLQVRLQARTAPDWAVPMQVRSGITLLYAHWEGFVKASGEALVEFVRDQDLTMKELAPGYLAIALRKDFATIRESKTGALTPEIQLTRLLRDWLAQPVSLKPRGSMPTASNLSWRQFSMIAARLEINIDEFALLEHLIDQRLVHARNTIAHGDRTTPLERHDFIVLHAKVVGLLDRFAQHVLRVADDDLYRV